MSVFLSIEGLHGVGKSTIAQLVAEKMGTVLTPTIPEEFSTSRRFVNNASSLEARYMLFLSAVLSAGGQIEQEFKAGHDVVVESYIFRTIAFHEGMGSLLRISIPDGLFRPTHTVLLTCASSIRAERLEQRGGLRSKWDLRAESRSQEIAQRYAQFGFPSIDTSLLEPQEIAERIWEMIYGHD